MKLLLATQTDFETLGDFGPESKRVIGVLAGDDIALHYIRLGQGDELDATTKRDSSDYYEEARMRAIELSAQPLEELHIALSDIDEDDGLWLAICDRDTIEAHVARFAKAGLELEALVPAAMMLPEGSPAPYVAKLGDKILIRTPEFATLAEPELASLLIGQDLPETILPLQPVWPTEPNLDLLQGDLTPRTRWWKERSFWIPASILTGLLVLGLATPSLSEMVRTKAAITTYDQATIELAAQTTPSAPRAETAEQAAQQLAALRKQAEGSAVGAKISFVAATIEAAPQAHLIRLDLQENGELHLQVGGDAQAINNLSSQLMSGPFTGRQDGTKTILNDRRSGVAADPSMHTRAMLRLVNARADAALAQARQAVPKLPLAAILSAMKAAGLEPQADGSRIQIPAARSQALLPLLADLDRKGARFQTLSISKNPDNSLSSQMSFLS